VPKKRRGNTRGILESEGTSGPIESVGEATSSASRQGVGQGNPTDDREGPLERRLDEEEKESFPASDPHSDWVGPPD
jgi:hypothetical protein